MTGAGPDEDCLFFICIRSLAAEMRRANFITTKVFIWIRVEIFVKMADFSKINFCINAIAPFLSFLRPETTMLYLIPSSFQMVILKNKQFKLL